MFPLRYVNVWLRSGMFKFMVLMKNTVKVRHGKGKVKVRPLTGGPVEVSEWVSVAPAPAAVRLQAVETDPESGP